MWNGKLAKRLRAVRNPEPSGDLRARLERGIPDSFQPRESGWSPGRIGIMAKIGVASAATMAVVWLVIALMMGTGGTGLSVAAVLDEMARASGEAGAVHLVMRVSSREGEDFSFVDLAGNPQTFEAWIEGPVQAGGPGRARISKGDRVYACDGRTMIAWHPTRGEALRGEGCAMDLDLFWPASWVRQMQGVPADRVELIAGDREGATGRLVVREPGVETAGRPPVFLPEFDRETEITWDRATRRLTGLRRWVLHDGRHLYADLVSVEYLPAADAGLFTIDLPADVRWVELRDAPASLALLGPREVALQFLQAAARGDRETLEILGASPHVAEGILEMGIDAALSVGQPFRTGAYPGVYVPYAIRVRHAGRAGTREYQLALRNDNPRRRWVFDGGL